MSDASEYYQTLTPDEFIKHVQAATYTPPSQTIVQELLQRYADLVDHDIARANEEDELIAAAREAGIGVPPTAYGGTLRPGDVIPQVPGVYFVLLP